MLHTAETGWWDQHDGYGEFHADSYLIDEETEWRRTLQSARSVCLIPED